MTEETKNDRFRRLATARGDRLLKQISLLGNLSNTRNYDYSPEEVHKLFAVIEDELRDCKQRFVAAKVKRKVEI